MVEQQNKMPLATSLKRQRSTQPIMSKIQAKNVWQKNKNLKGENWVTGY